MKVAEVDMFVSKDSACILNTSGMNDDSQPTVVVFQQQDDQFINGAE
jgi:hypothetical protein